ncbi:hydroxyectoine utilization dehydratase EutB [Pseudohoeflea coraliihabitans]|uniref:Hydroxyectoine utilization dehydratase EutB n=1 Tax=Pseudohoeflea coraliihabitans TaxID=2860393 RepID=A0ABS6WKL5_9HYPH|nr:hydroxyectoine utilization dehydratase EutB [Pseudohoeflea sp. DP4N28-3]MBW3096198.1 hydroxyectoine utilization dehydratase EutB [Pseudohoeflea sp. DP4N28-3]
MNDNSMVSLNEIEAARARVADTIRVTPVNLSESLSARLGVPVHLKLEYLQRTGSFKLRGAANAVSRLSEAEKAAGVVGVSTGNHGRGLAYAASRAGVRCIICMSELVPQVKIDGIRAQGAEVRIVGRSQDEAQGEVDKLVAEGMTMIPPFDHRDVIAGQGTLGLEILDAVPDAATLVVPLSGGGLIAGVAAAAKARKPEIRIVGVSMERGAAMVASLRAGHPVEVEELPTLADSLGGGIGLDNRFTFAMTQRLVDETLLLSEDQIAAGIAHAYWQERQIIEGSGAVGIAAVLAGSIAADGPVVLILSGGNVDMKQHFEVIGRARPDGTSKEA